MRRDAPTSKPGGNAPLRMATGHAIVNFCLADRSRGLREGCGDFIGMAIEPRMVGAQEIVNRMGCRAVKDVRGAVPANRDGGGRCEE